MRLAFLIVAVISFYSENVNALEAYQVERLRAIEAKFTQYQKYIKEGQERPDDSDEIRELRLEIRQSTSELEKIIKDIQLQYGKEMSEFDGRKKSEKALEQAKQSGELREIAELTTRKAIRSFGSIFGAGGMKKAVLDATCDRQIHSYSMGADIQIENIVSAAGEIRTLRREQKQKN